MPRYLIHFSDGGAGMRDYDEPLEVGQEIRDGVNGRYVVERVKSPAADGGLGHAWAIAELGAGEPGGRSLPT